jgi:RNA polymerase sigma-70 factor (ECF subfamily)
LVSQLAALPEADRAVIELVDLAGFRPKEAAAALGLRPGTVRMRLMRARSRLRQETTGQNQLPATNQPSATNQNRGDRND